MEFENPVEMGGGSFFEGAQKMTPLPFSGMKMGGGSFFEGAAFLCIPILSFVLQNERNSRELQFS